jgi:hypothetical protein
MAKRLDNFEFGSGGSRRGRPSKYPWNQWTDGSVWEIRRPEDFTLTNANMQSTLHDKAAALSMKVTSESTADGQGLVFQFRRLRDFRETMERLQNAQEPAPE